MKKLMVAIAGAVALTCSAFAAEATSWFNGGVTNAWPNATEMKGGAWDDDAATKGEWDDTAKVLVVDADADDPLAFNATAAKTIGDDATSVTISSDVKFTPFETLPEIPENAKAAVVLCGDTYCIVEYDKAGGTNQWLSTATTNMVGNPVRLNVTISDVAEGIAQIGYHFVRITEGPFMSGFDVDTQIKFPDGSDNTISAANYIGDGEITALTATYEANTVTITGATAIDNATYVVSNNNQQVELPGAVPYGSDVIVTYTANDGYLFAGGAKVWSVTKQATAGVIATEVAEQGLKEAPAEINGTLFYTVQAAFDAATAGQTVTLRTDATEAVINANAASFTFDLNGKTISNATATATIKQDVVGSTLTITDGATGGKVVNTANEMDKGIAVWARQGSVVIEKGSFENASQYEATVYIGKAATAAGSTITINGGTFKNVNANPYEYKKEWSKLALNIGNDFTNTSAIVVNAGSFSTDPANGDDQLGGTFLADKAISQFNASTGLYDAFVPAAKIGTKYYITLQDAVNDAEEYAEIYLCSDITLTSRIDIEKPLTIFTEGGKGNPEKWFTIYTTATCANGSAFNVTSDLTLKYVKIDGTAVTATECDPITVRKDAVAWIYNVAITINSKNGACVYAFDGGSISIDGDDTFFWNKTTETYEFNPNFKAMTVNQDSNSKAGTQLIEIMGGTFKGQNPDDGDDSGNCETFLSEGYTSYWTANGWKVSGDDPEAKIGGVFYLTLKDAVDAVKNNETIALCDDVTVNDEISVAKAGVTIDLAYNTLTVGNKFAVSSAPAGCSLTIKNGTVTSTARTFILRSYGAALTLEDVELDAENLTASATGYTGALLIPSGNLTLKGETSIVNVDDGLNAIAFDNYASSGYTLGTLDFGKAEIEGNVLIAGGTVKNADTANFDDDTEFIIAAAANSYCTEATFEGSGLVAMTGTLPTGKAPSTPSYQVNITGKAFLSFNDAYDAIEEGEKITCLADISVGAQTDKGYEIDANGKIVTVTGCIIDAGTVKLVNSKSKAPAMEGSEGGFLINTLVTVKSGAELDMSEMPFGTVYGGVQDASKGAVNLVDGSKATFYYWGNPGWEYVDSPNWMYANMPAFFWGSVIPVGAEVTIGDKTWTGTENGFELEDTVAFAEIEVLGNIGGTTYPLTVNECYTSLDAAIKAVKVGGTVKLADNIATAKAQQWTIDKNITIDFATYTIIKMVPNDWVFQIAKDADVTFAGTTGGIIHYPAKDNQVNPASMIQVLGKLTVNGGVYKSDYAVFKVDEGNGAKGELVVNDGTFTITAEPKWAGKLTFTVMNWSKATLNGGTFNGTVGTMSDDGNTDSQAGETIVGGTIAGTPNYTFYMYGSTYANVPKIKGVEATDVTLVKASTITTDLYVVKSGEYVTVSDSVEAKIGNVFYMTLAEAISEAADDDTVTLVKDIETDVKEQWTISKNIELDFDNYTITKKVSNDWVFTIAKGADVTFTGSTGGISFNPIEAGNKDYPASMVQIFGKLTVDGGNYSSDFTIFKVDEDGGCSAAGELYVSNGTFTIVDAEDYEGPQWAVMNWSTATIEGGDWYGVIGTRSSDANKTVKAGQTTIGDNVSGEPEFLLYVGYKGDTTYENLPKIKGVDMVDVKLDQTATITDELELTEDGDWVTVQKKSEGPYTPPTGGGTVEPTGEPGFYEVTPDPSSGIVTIAGGLSETDTIIVTITNDFTIVGVPEDQIEIILNDIVVPNTAFVGGDENGFSTALNPDGDVDDVPVRPTLIEETPTEKPFVVGDSVETTVQAIPGLTYKLMRGDEPGAYPTQADKQSAGEEAETITLTDADKPEGKAFYVIQVEK